MLSLIKFLPNDSAFARAASSTETGGWGPTEYLLADLFDLTARAHFKEPKRYPRPHELAEQKRAEDARRSKLIQRAQARRASASTDSGE